MLLIFTSHFITGIGYIFSMALITTLATQRNQEQTICLGLSSFCLVS